MIPNKHHNYYFNRQWFESALVRDMVTSSLPEKVVLDKAGLIILRTFEMDYNKAGSALTGNEEGDPSHSNSVIMASWLIARS